MDQRLDFVIACRSGTVSISALCRLFRISRQTGHKWLKRFSPGDGAASLKERSRKPLRNPEATPARLAARIVAYRKQHPTWGARKLLWLLFIHWPKLRRAGLRPALLALRRAKRRLVRGLQRSVPRWRWDVGVSADCRRPLGSDFV
jgi:hypothetical protein